MPFSKSPQSVAKFPSELTEKAVMEAQELVSPNQIAAHAADNGAPNARRPPSKKPRSSIVQGGMLELLHERQLGRRQSNQQVVVPWSSSPALASSVAWNPSRMRNMILVVGPGTPASVCWEHQQGHGDDEDDDDDDNIHPDQWSYASSEELVLRDDSEEEEDSEEEDDGDDDLDHYHALNDDDDDDDAMETEQEQAPAAAALASQGGVERGETKRDREDASSSSNSSDEDSAEEMDDDDDAEQQQRQERAGARFIRNRSLFQFLRRRILDAEESSDGEAEILLPSSAAGAAPSRHGRARRRTAQSERTASWLPSLRHGGCINTACWMDCPWRISKPSPSSSPFAIENNSLEDCPTQLVTSGDDRLIKIWDVSHAMGRSSPASGGWDTFTPFLHTSSPAEKLGTAQVHRAWKQQYQNREGLVVPGGVQLLAQVSSGHRGNVFYVTPVHHQPGKVLTCGADGYLRLSDFQSETSTVVLSPFLGPGDDAMDDDDDYFGLRGGMAYSHQMLTAHTGLLCSERGLHHFDLRLSPREQGRQSLMLAGTKARGRSGRPVACKACAVWRPNNSSTNDDIATSAPTMVFVGGSSEYVELLDLRMDGSSKKVLQRYRPRCLDEVSSVSVSGLDVSKDRRELLVSYESDQIYSFPVFPDAASSAGPTVDEIGASSTRFSEDPDAFLPELASYGGHLNRFTFLKNAKYAGPNDDYIITGSDSGNAWMYERKTGTVVSLLSADSSTCNGVVAHPSLPFFITYGIDSTAKLWRAAPCVEPGISDSPSRRAEISLNSPYEMSPVARSWDGVQALIRKIDDKPSSMPDFVASSEEIANSGRFSSQVFRGICGEDSPRIGNSIRNLPMLLRMNRYECYRAEADYSRSVPVEQPLDHFSHRVSLIRLRLQADRLGLQWNPLVPWAFQCEGRQHEIHPADLVPDNPSDWILFDKQMSTLPLDIQMNFNLKDYEKILQTSFPDNPAFFESPEGDAITTIPWLTKEQQTIDDDDICDALNPSSGLDSSEDGTDDDSNNDEARACNARKRLFKLKSQKLLYETAALLKEAGNQAVKKGLLQVAARRYDKAIQYCAVAFMQYAEGNTNLKHLTGGHHADLAMLDSSIKGNRLPNTVVVWSPLLRILITARLNLSLLLAKPEFAQPSRASDQARAALKLLLPFTRKEGKVYSGFPRNEKKKDIVVNDHEPIETFQQAKELQAKAYFRLGSAELDMDDYSASIKSFELALKSSNKASPNKKADSLLLRRLQEAKRKRKAKKKRDRQKFQRFVNGEADEGSTADPDE